MPDFTELKQKHRTVWASGDYDQIARGIQAVADHVVRSGCIRTGERVLDIACGTGNTALMARARGAVVTGVDLTPELLAVARRRAADAGYSDITWIEGDAENLPLPDGGFGAVFTDVDQPDGSGPGVKRGNRRASTLIEYFGADGELLFSSFVPASPGDGSLSFFGIVFDDARIARVRIETGNVAPGPNDDRHHDIVMMDDFIYGEPQLLQ